MYKNEMLLKEVWMVLIVPIVFSVIFNLSYEIQTMLYMMIIAYLSSIEISYSPKQYGEIVYRSQSILICRNHCLIAVWTVQLLMYVLFVITGWSTILFACFETLCLILIIKQHLSMIFYTKGLLHKGAFYSWEAIHEAYHVKNYKEVYEIHLGSNKVIKLTAEELALTKEVG